jgi:DNA-binding LacI/PurR family transcriptional regulator
LPNQPTTPKKPARLKDVAEKAGVSLATASMAIGNHPSISVETRQLVWQVSREIGYDRLRGRGRGGGSSGKSARIGIVLVVGQSAHSKSYHPSFFFDVVSRSDSSLRFEYSATPQAATTAQALEHTLRFATGMDGLILIDMVDHPFLIGLHANKVPHVVVGNIVEPPGNPRPSPSCSVNFDPLTMGLAATSYLFARKHTHIGFLCETMPANFQSDHWCRGYHLSHLQAKQPVNPELIGISANYPLGVSSIADAWAKMKNRPTAIVSAEAALVPQMLYELNKRAIRIEPKDIIVNCVEETARPFGLTDFPRISGRTDLMVKHAIELLRQLIAHPVENAYEIRVPFECVNME